MLARVRMAKLFSGISMRQLADASVVPDIALLLPSTFMAQRLSAGLKMVAEFSGVGISTQLSLAVVASVLTGGVGLSLLLPIVPPPPDDE